MKTTNEARHCSVCKIILWVKKGQWLAHLNSKKHKENERKAKRVRVG